MTRFVAINLTGLTPPDVVETLVYEDILAELKTDIVARFAEMDVEYDVQMLESDPVVKILEVAAYREVLLRARVNTAARAIMLAYAQGNDLDHLAAYYGVERRLITAAEDTEDGVAVYEDDELLRERVQIAPEALSVAGPEGAYRFHAMTVDTSIKDVGVLGPSTVISSGAIIPGAIHVIPLVNTGNGVPSENILTLVNRRLREEDIRPLTDMVTVRAPIVTNYTIQAQLILAEGPDATTVRAAALKAVQAYALSRHRVGMTVHKSGIIAALQVAGVENVILTSPTADVVPSADGVAYCTSVTLT